MNAPGFWVPESPAAIIEGIVENDRLWLARRVDRRMADCIVTESGGVGGSTELDGCRSEGLRGKTPS